MYMKTPYGFDEGPLLQRDTSVVRRSRCLSMTWSSMN